MGKCPCWPMLWCACGCVHAGARAVVHVRVGNGYLNLQLRRVYGWCACCGASMLWCACCGAGTHAISATALYYPSTSTGTASSGICYHQRRRQPWSRFFQYRPRTRTDARGFLLGYDFPVQSTPHSHWRSLSGCDFIEEKKIVSALASEIG